MPHNLNQNTSVPKISVVTLQTMGVNMKHHYQENEDVFMGDKGKAHAKYTDGQKNIHLTFRKQSGQVMITKTIKQYQQGDIIIRQKVELH